MFSEVRLSAKVYLSAFVFLHSAGAATNRVPVSHPLFRDLGLKALNNVFKNTYCCCKLNFYYITKNASLYEGFVCLSKALTSFLQG